LIYLTIDLSIYLLFQYSFSLTLKQFFLIIDVVWGFLGNNNNDGNDEIEDNISNEEEEEDEIVAKKEVKPKRGRPSAASSATPSKKSKSKEIEEKVPELEIKKSKRGKKN
jgi:hypothetical protein